MGYEAGRATVQRGSLKLGVQALTPRSPTRPQLTSCVHASCALLYPMRWEHVLIPTLPPHLLDYCW